ncbi:MAG: porin [Paracoccaceae bacterium]
MTLAVKTLALSSAFAIICALPAAAEFRYDTSSGGEVLFYGHLNPAYQSFDDGVTTTRTVVDSGHSNSRVGFWVRQPLGAGQFAFNFETGLGLRPGGAVTQGFTPDEFRWRRTNIRKVDLSLKTANAGTFYLGQGSMATDGAAETDLSGTALVLYVSVPDSAAAFRFRDSTGALTTRTIGGNFGDFDGGRLGRIRYDTPSLAGFTLSVAYGEEILAQNVNLKTRDIALRYAQDFNGARVEGSIGYKRVTPANAQEFNDTIGSISVLLPSGFNVTLAAGRRSTAGSYTYGKLGYRGDWFSVGETAIAVDYYNGKDRTVAGSQSDAYGLGIIQKFERANIEAYLGWR